MPRPFHLVAKQPKVNVGEANYAFQCKAFKLPRCDEQFLYAASMGRRFRADFCFVDYQLLIEMQGGIWRPGGGAHSHPINLQRDIEKQQHAALLGFLVLPFTPQQVKSGFAIDWTSQVLYKLGWRPA